MAYSFNPFTGKLDDVGTGSTGASTSTANTWTANQTFSGTANTAPSQTAASGSSLMTRDLVDARVGVMYVMTQTTDLASLASTTVYTNGASITLPAGTFCWDGWAECDTASTTSGINLNINANLSNMTDCMGSVAIWQIATQAGAYQTLSNSPVRQWRRGALVAGYLMNGYCDAPNKSAITQTNGTLTLSNPTTFTFQISQRTAVDSANLAYLRSGTFLRFIKVS